MRLTRYLLLSIGGIMLLATAVLTGYTYQGVKSSTYERLYSESEAIYHFLMSVRRVYQKQFLESGIALNDKTVGFLPAHSLPRISDEFSSNWDKRGIQISTVSDRPRNPRNLADVGELEAMAWFREDDERAVFTKSERSHFLYARPIWVVPSCLRCHGDPEKAPPSIQARYEGTAFGYEVGDLRGVVSVRIPISDIDETVLESFVPRFLVLLIAFLMISFAVYGVVRHLIVRPLGEMVDDVRSIDEHNSYSHMSEQHEELGEFVGHFNQMMDRQQQLHSELREQKEKMEWILESMEEGVIVTDLDGRILRINQKLEQWTGWPTITHFGAPVRSLFVENDALSGQKQCHLRRDGDERMPVHVSVGELRNSMDRSAVVEGKVFVIHDRREQIRAEQQEAYAAYQAGIAEMSTMILHNVGNALSAIDGGVFRLKNQVSVLKKMESLFEMVADKLESLKGEELPERCVDAVNEIRSMVDRSRGLVLHPLLEEVEDQALRPIEHSVRHVAEIIRVQQGSARQPAQEMPCQLQLVVEDALVLQRYMLERLGIEIVKQMPEAEREVVLSRNQMVQVVNNLIKNSYESISEQRQKVPDLQGVIKVSLSQDEEQSHLVITDNGIGIEEEQLDKIFEYGFSSKDRGSGFGLHASVNYIEEMGGEFIVESEGSGQGASVTVVIPNQEIARKE